MCILVPLVWLCLSAMQRVQPQFRQVHARARHRPSCPCFPTAATSRDGILGLAAVESVCLVSVDTTCSSKRVWSTPSPTLSLPFLCPPIPCWLGGCSSRVAYSTITAARNFLYSAPIGICRCASSPIGPEIRRMKYSPTYKVVWKVGPRKGQNFFCVSHLRSRSLELGLTFVQ